MMNELALLWGVALVAMFITGFAVGADAHRPHQGCGFLFFSCMPLFILIAAIVLTILRVNGMIGPLCHVYCYMVPTK